MEIPTYIHYGSTKFDPGKNFPISNRECWMKPKRGLWASRKDATYGWKDWCQREKFRICDIANSFEFVMKDEIKIFTISNTVQLYSLPGIKEPLIHPSYYLIDFEKCLRLGIDAIELCWYGDEYRDVASGNLYEELYGWDCGSMVVLNPDAVIPLERSNEREASQCISSRT